MNGKDEGASKPKSSAEENRTAVPQHHNSASIANNVERQSPVPRKRTFFNFRQKDFGFQGSKTGCWGTTRNTAAVVLEVSKRHPCIVVAVPVLVFCILAGLGLFGVISGVHSEVKTNQDTTLAVAVDAAASFQLSVDRTFTPLVGLNAFIQQTPNAMQLLPRFPSICKDLITQLPPGLFKSLQFSPMGHILDVYPDDQPWPYNGSHRGINIFEASPLRPGAISTLKAKQLTMSGPQDLVGGGFGGIARLPIFVANVSADETFGMNVSLPYDMELADVYNFRTRTKFWGFVTAMIDFQDLLEGRDVRLQAFRDKGYRYRLTRPDRAGPYTIAVSSPPPSGHDSITIRFPITNTEWTLMLYPSGGWKPVWEPYVITAVVVLSLAVALLVFVMLLNLMQRSWLLKKMTTANRMLEETTHVLEGEKARTEALLVRQYNLIQCFAAPRHPKDPPPAEDGSIASSREFVTVDRIESMRRQLTQSNVKTLAENEQIQSLELLGEGTYGKVYKGLWRGTVVAVKTMVLPANMTGQEKREKMAVMEAAISSSLSHPNVVQTYTYNVKPVREAATTPAEQLDPSVLLMGGGSTQSSALGKALAQRLESSTSQSCSSPVHSYEVRLVLEFCDKGCLRDALDKGCFLTPRDGLNYRAILDTALDIAKAMVHLHSRNVLHSDLKSRNIMLKSAGEPRAIIAKVADFGLSVKMDHMETHMSNVFQGTLTHMAPEVLLEGRISKAADVYAFGITLWELFSGGHAFAGTQRALLGHLITKEGKRPEFNPTTPSAYRQLAECCWQPNADARPTFDEILETLLQMRHEVGGETPPVIITPTQPDAAPDVLFKLQNGPFNQAADGRLCRSMYLEQSFEEGASGASTWMPCEGSTAMSTSINMNSTTGRARGLPTLQMILEAHESDTGRLSTVLSGALAKAGGE